MQKLFYIFILLVGLLPACTFRHPAIQEVEAYHHVYVNARRTKMNIALVQTDGAYQISVRSNHLDSLKYFVRNDTLHIRVPMHVTYNYFIELRTPEFRSIDSYLVSKIYTPDTLNQDSLYIKADKKVLLNMHVSRLRFAHPTKNKVKLAGSADIAYIGERFSGMNLDASNLLTKNMYLSLNDSKAKVNVSDSLWIQDAFLSKITYVGTPHIMECNMKWSILNNAFFFF